MHRERTSGHWRQCRCVMCIAKEEEEASTPPVKVTRRRPMSTAFAKWICVPESCTCYMCVREAYVHPPIARKCVSMTHSRRAAKNAAKCAPNLGTGRPTNQ